MAGISRMSREEDGAVSMGTVLTFALIGGAVYAALAFGPAYIDDWELSSAVHEAANMGWREPSDEALRELIYKRARNLGSHEVEKDGETVVVPGIPLDEDSVQVDRDNARKRIVVQVRYTRTVYFPFTKKSRELHFNPAAVQSLEAVKW